MSPPVLDVPTAQAVVEPVDPDYPVSEVVTCTGGEVSWVFEVRGGTHPLVVKVYAPQNRPKLIKEVYVYRLLARHGIRQIPRVLHAAPRGIAALPYAHTIMTRLPGRPLAQAHDELSADEQSSVYRQMGRLLASVHRIAQDHWGYVTTRVVDTRDSNTAYMTDQFARRLRDFADLGGHPALARAIEAYVRRHATRFAACTAPVLCHNDFHDSNVLVAGAQVSGFVDVEGAVAADPLFDLARTDYSSLRVRPRGSSVQAQVSGRNVDGVREAFLAGYGPLPPDWAERVALYHLHHALEFWNWAAVTGNAAEAARASDDLATLLHDSTAPIVNTYLWD